MPKIDKILILLELLYNRSYVTLQTIQDMCNVSERTAFRYIGTLIDANFTIEFDSDSGGYRILDKRSIVSTFSYSEVAIAYLSTLLLEHFAGNAAQDCIKTVRLKLESKISKRLQKVLDAGLRLLHDSSSPLKIKEWLIMSLVLLATELGSDVRISYIGDNSETEQLDLTRPQLLHEKEWAICGKHSEIPNLKIPIRFIRDIDVLPIQM